LKRADFSIELIQLRVMMIDADGLLLLLLIDHVGAKMSVWQVEVIQVHHHHSSHFKLTSTPNPCTITLTTFTNIQRMVPTDRQYHKEKQKKRSVVSQQISSIKGT
jgi:hypothetical protein